MANALATHRPRVPAAGAAARLGGRQRAGRRARVPGRGRVPPRAGQGARRPRPPDRERRARSAPTTVAPPRRRPSIVQQDPEHAPARRRRAVAWPTPIESFTAVLLQLNVHYKTRVAVKFTGIPEVTAIDGSMRLYDTARQGSCRSSRARSSRCTRAASRRTTPRHLGHAAVYVTYDVLQRRLRDLGHETRACATSPTSTTRSSRKARELGVHYLDLAAAETARFDGDMAGARPAAVLERAPRHVGDRRHPRLHRHGARPRPRLPGRRRGVLRRRQLRPVRPGEPPRAATRCSPSRPSGAATPTTRTSASRSNLLARTVGSTMPWRQAGSNPRRGCRVRGNRRSSRAGCYR